MNKSKALEELKDINERRAKERSGGTGGDQKEFMPFLAPKELDFGVRYKFRILPACPTKNPDGYVQIPRVSIHTDMPIGKYGNPSQQVFTLDRSGFIEKNLPATYLENFLFKMWQHFDEVGTPSKEMFSDESHAALFWASVKAAGSVQWRTWEYPTLWWATCATKMSSGDGKTKKSFANYVPSGGANPLPRVFQFTQQYFQNALIQLDELVRTPAGEDDDRDLSNHELNSATDGYDLAFIRKDEKPYPKIYAEIFSTAPAKPLAPALLEAYGPESDMYPNLLERVKKTMKTDQELKDAIDASWWGKFVQSNYNFTLD